MRELNPSLNPHPEIICKCDIQNLVKNSTADTVRGVPEREYTNAPGLIWLYKRIEQLGFKSLSEFAEFCGVNKGNLHRYFVGETKPSIAMLPTLCTSLEVSVGELLEKFEIEIPTEYL